jgi:hypothetical protein
VRVAVMLPQKLFNVPYELPELRHRACSVARSAPKRLR